MAATGVLRKRMVVLLALVALALTGFYAGTTLAARDAPPPPPPWVDAEGKTDPSDLPDRVPVAGPDGQTVGWIELEKTPPRPGSRGAAGPVEVTNNRGEVVGHFARSGDDPGSPYRFVPVDD